MDTEVREYYNIVEIYTDGRDVGSFLYENKIRYDLRVTQDIEAEIDLNWMATMKPTVTTIYTAKLTGEEAMLIGLTFPTLKIYKPVIKESVAKMARRVLQL